MSGLPERIEAWSRGFDPTEGPDVRAGLADLLAELEAGRVRAATPGVDRSWEVHAWSKRGILLAFRLGRIAELPAAGPLTFAD